MRDNMGTITVHQLVRDNMGTIISHRLMRDKIVFSCRLTCVKSTSMKLFQHMYNRISISTNYQNMITNHLNLITNHAYIIS